MTSHPHSSEKERDNIVNVVLKWINDLPLDRVALVQITSDEWKRLYTALESREKDLLAQSHQSAEADREALRNKFLGPVLFKFGMAIRAVCGKKQGEKLLDKLDPLEQEIMAAVDAYTAALKPPKEEDV